MRRIHLWLVAGAFMAFASPFALAQSVDQQMNVCSNQETSVAQVISSCTAVLNAPGTSDATRARAHGSRAVGYLAIGNADAALADYVEAARLAPNELSWSLNAANAYMGRNDYAHAIDYLNQAARTSPNNTFVLKLRAQARLNSRDFAGAIADVDALAASRHADAETLEIRGMAHANLNDHASAIADFTAAIAMNPNDALLFYHRAQGYQLAADYAREVADLDRADSLAPSNAEILRTRCFARTIWNQQLDQALADCDAAVRLQRDNVLVMTTRAIVHLRRSEWQASAADGDAALAMAPAFAEALYCRGIARLRLGQTTAGQTDLSTATARDPGVTDRFAGYGITP